VTWRHSRQERRPQLRHSESLKTLKTSGHSQPNHTESIRRKFGDDKENNFMLYTLSHIIFIYSYFSSYILILLIFSLIPPPSFLYFFLLLPSAPLNQLRSASCRNQKYSYKYQYTSTLSRTSIECCLIRRSVNFTFNLHSITSVFLFLYNFFPSVLLLRPYFLSFLKFFTSSSSSSLLLLIGLCPVQ
jgi:hypothetical protein